MLVSPITTILKFRSATYKDSYVQGIQYLRNMKLLVSESLNFAYIIHEFEQLLSIIPHYVPEFGFIFDIVELR